MIGKKIEGRYINLLPATVEDAVFTRNIRMDSRFSKYFPKMENTVEDQINWIKKQREKTGDYFFVVWDKKGNRIGTIGLYDYDGETCEAGRLAIDGNAFQSIEAQILSFEYAFNILCVKRTISYIFEDNERALRFSKSFGGTFEKDYVHSNPSRRMLKKTTTKEQFCDASKKLKRMIYR